MCPTGRFLSPSLQDEDGQETLSFEFQKIKYSYEIEGKKQFLPIAFPVEHPLCYYQNARGYQEDKEIRAAERKYGTNKYVFLHAGASQGRWDQRSQTTAPSCSLNLHFPEFQWGQRAGLVQGGS